MIELNINAKKEKFHSIPALNGTILKHQVGSRAICFPVPMDTDDDWLFWVIDKEKAIKELEAQGWTIDGNYPSSKFTSLRQNGNEVNVIVVDDCTYYAQFINAVAICKKFNVTDKKTRIWIHSKVFCDD